VRAEERRLGLRSTVAAASTVFSLSDRSICRSVARASACAEASAARLASAIHRCQAARYFRGQLDTVAAERFNLVAIVAHDRPSQRISAACRNKS